MKEYKGKNELLNECLVYTNLGQDISPQRVKQMVKDAFRHGYETAINNYSMDKDTTKEE